jgi:hypothetical protein
MRRVRVHAFLEGEHADTRLGQLVHRGRDRSRRAPETVDGQQCHEIEFASLGVLQMASSPGRLSRPLLPGIPPRRPGRMRLGPARHGSAKPLHQCPPRPPISPNLPQFVKRQPQIPIGRGCGKIQPIRPAVSSFEGFPTPARRERPNPSCWPASENHYDCGRSSASTRRRPYPKGATQIHDLMSNSTTDAGDG